MPLPPTSATDARSRDGWPEGLMIYVGERPVLDRSERERSSRRGLGVPSKLLGGPAVDEHGALPSKMVWPAFVSFSLGSVDGRSDVRWSNHATRSPPSETS